VVTITPINSMLDRMVTLSRAMDQAFVNGTTPDSLGKAAAQPAFVPERDWGTFTRSLRVPQHVAGDKISATFDAGVPTVRIPKTEAAKPRKITVTTVPVATVPVATVPVATVPVATVPVATVPAVTAPAATAPAPKQVEG
jgi:hypothetical protein